MCVLRTEKSISDRDYARRGIPMYWPHSLSNNTKPWRNYAFVSVSLSGTHSLPFGFVGVYYFIPSAVIFTIPVHNGYMMK